VNRPVRDPADFVVDRIGFSPMFGDRTTTLWGEGWAAV